MANVTSADSRTPIDPKALRALIGPRWEVECVAETGSTNADLLAAAVDGAVADGFVRVAEYQHGGRGRLDRTWTSPPGAGLTLSMLLRPRVPIALWGWLPLLAGLALREAVAASPGGADAQPWLKWPNDLLLGPDQRKVAGILVQVAGAGAGGGMAAAVVGLGVNVSTEPAELPVPTATSLAIEGCSTDRTALAAGLLDHFDGIYQQWQDAAGDVVATGLLLRYREACSTIGSPVTLELASGSVPAQALDIDAQGRLVVLVAGEEAPRPLTAGDVTHLRAGSG
ncbi:MAG: biotin/acetyl-CoA-carboxylase ligase [Frankiales bacterium]|jgi:BirA family biotin operon repressor/biotin-[acetyl-CoA-carboxylase] ligase|nr:biotin/acetyl-CoA-carboxylase ligase [Frankiales bacterium]